MLLCAAFVLAIHGSAELRIINKSAPNTVHNNLPTLGALKDNFVLA
jgi:hypothetical protein